MLKAIQIIGCSSGFISQRLKKKPRSGNGFPLIPSSYGSTSLFLHPFSATKTRSLRVIQMFSTQSESNSDAPSSSSSPVAVHSAGNVHKTKFCQWCGGPAKHEIPPGEEKIRAICTLCGKIAYQNPKMVVGCLIEHDKKILLCKRNIEPSYGLWTLPAGYLEIGESAAEGAIRETWEEAGAEVEVVSPFAQLDIPRIGQTYIIFLAKLKKPHFSPGPESSECCLFELDNIPFDSLAFSSIFVTLTLYIEDVKSGKIRFHYGTINKRLGTGPSDIRAFTLDNHLEDLTSQRDAYCSKSRSHMTYWLEVESTTRVHGARRFRRNQVCLVKPVTDYLAFRICI